MPQLTREQAKTIFDNDIRPFIGRMWDEEELRKALDILQQISAIETIDGKITKAKDLYNKDKNIPAALIWWYLLASAPAIFNDKNSLGMIIP